MGLNGGKNGIDDDIGSKSYITRCVTIRLSILALLALQQGVLGVLNMRHMGEHDNNSYFASKWPHRRQYAHK